MFALILENQQILHRLGRSTDQQPEWLIYGLSGLSLQHISNPNMYINLKSDPQALAQLIF